ncbi:TetR/AcrR family transcriptional regulator [Streptomyces sp. NBC_00986]|uniref:TetR/AcrR family transcriptional regulator n=1 Tax=Streptomyces sp. NBC_00986 TaxID=2903702 RepID=UPI0038694649|nr:TetR/AcrR family transcriptional regulator [Streptomyces sp. NBC_00986]WSX64544.1 TetR/AcrR family transcriptional regulator [Streptomyces sp. NBC_00986]
MAAGKNEVTRKNSGTKRSAALFWGGKDRASRGPKPALSVELIVAAAVKIADAEGLQTVSMQRVASELGFTPMSLYRYLPGKADLIDFMIDTAIGEPPALDEETGGWRPKLERWARELTGVYHRHPWMFELAARPRLMGPNQLNWLEVAVSAFAGTGLTGAEELDAVFTVSGLVQSWNYRSSGPEPVEQDTPDDQWGSAVAEIVREHSDRYPALMAAMSSGAFDPAAGDGEEFGLRCVLDGIETLIAGRAAHSTAV